MNDPDRGGGEDVAGLKAEIRKEMRGRMKDLDADVRREGSRRICERIVELSEWRGALRVLAYVPSGWEVDIWPLVIERCASGGGVGLPAYDPEKGAYSVRWVENPMRDLIPGKFGIAEPCGHCRDLAVRELDFALVPGLAFGPAGERLGRGAGFYDRLLSEFEGTLCGVAHKEQLKAGLPLEMHDRQMNMVVTPDCVVRCGNSL